MPSMLADDIIKLLKKQGHCITTEIRDIVDDFVEEIEDADEGIAEGDTLADDEDEEDEDE